MRVGNVLGLLVLFVVVFIGAQIVARDLAQETWLKSLPAQGFTPGTLVIEKDAPAKNLVCVVPDRGGTYACVTVGELRAYVLNRKQFK